MNKTICKFINWSFKIYVVIASLVGTCVILWPFIVLLYNGIAAPAPMPVYLPNGFVFQHDRNTKVLKYVILDADKNTIVMPDVKRIMWHDKTVYGFRNGPAKEVYFFICTYNEDCTNTQSYSDIEFNKIVKERKLPDFSYRLSKSYQALLLEQSKTSIGKNGG